MEDAVNNERLGDRFSELSTSLIADACLRLKLPLRVAPPGIRPLIAESYAAGRVLPVRHYGSVDIFLEVMGTAKHGDILVIDNGGRMDEACIGDLAEEVLSTARGIWQRERRQAHAIQAGKTLREQLLFDDYPARRATDPNYTFRRHLRSIGGAIEE